MTNFIPIFPLGVVVYPGEQLNLHIFEPRYKQLINECYAEDKPFGIPAVVGETMKEFGTLVRVVEVKEVYEDGKMDIVTRGEMIFRVLELIKEIPDKLYSGAIVTYPENDVRSASKQMSNIIASIYELHRLLRIEKKFPKPDEELRSYDVAHHAGLTLEQELELLQLMREDQRQEYLKRHLQNVLPIVTEMETLKERVKLNGHFRELKSWGL
ncbi:MAG TPA: LON peptidase substrate-binding domain-containing protein [Phnomibacter sp.]|nr:LON peptidase substrate-binding domain-containing protein [Phnomibacter sp.]